MRRFLTHLAVLVATLAIFGGGFGFLVDTADASQSDSAIMIGTPAQASSITSDVYHDPGSGGFLPIEKVVGVSSNGIIDIAVENRVTQPVSALDNDVHDALDVPNAALTASITVVGPPDSITVSAASTSLNCGLTTNCTTTNALNSTGPGSRAPTTSVRTIPGQPVDGNTNYNLANTACGFGIPISSMALCSTAGNVKESIANPNAHVTAPIDDAFAIRPSNVGDAVFHGKDRKFGDSNVWPLINPRLRHDDTNGSMTIDQKVTPGTDVDTSITNAYNGPNAPTTPRPGTDTKASPPTGITDAAVTTNPSTGSPGGGEPCLFCGSLQHLETIAMMVTAAALLGGLGVYLVSRGRPA